MRPQNERMFSANETAFCEHMTVSLSLETKRVGVCVRAGFTLL